MVKQLQKKFILAAMLAVSILLVVLISGINIFNYLTSVSENEKLTETLSDSFEASTMWNGEMFSQSQQEIPPKDNDRKGDNYFGKPDKNSVRSARYAAVAFDSSGNIIRTDVSHISSIKQEEAESAAASLGGLADGTGSYNGYMYRLATSKHADGRILILLDNSEQVSSFFSVLIISVGAGVFCWVLMLLFIILLSRKAIAPVARSIEKQKQFVTNAGHEIKTPLAIILANTDALELHNGESKWSKNIRAQTLRLSGLMQNLLMLAKMDESAAKLPMCRFDLSTAVKDTAEAFVEPAALKGVLIDIDIKRDIFVNGNRDSLIQLITVLMDNAVKYTESGGEITAELSCTDRLAVLKIANTCDNVENPEKLFDRFYRGDSARTQKNGGYGIGLSVAMAIAQLHKGSISAENIGGKLMFTVKLQRSFAD